MTKEGTSLTSLSTGMQRQVETRQVNPIAALFIELDTVNVSLLRVLDLLEKSRPQGRISSVARSVASGSVLTEGIIPNWFSFHLVNDGPDNLDFSVNDRKGPYNSLPAGESIDVDMGQGVIKKVSFKTDGQCSFRIYGVY